MRLSYLSQHDKEEVCLHEALISVFITLPEIRKLFTAFHQAHMHITPLLSSSKHVLVQYLKKQNLLISTPPHPDACLDFSWHKAKHQQNDQFWNKARISRMAVKHTPERPHLWRKPVWHPCLLCQSDQTSSPACAVCWRMTYERVKNREIKENEWVEMKERETGGNVCVRVFEFSAYPDISLCGDGFPLVQVNHLWGTVWQSRVPKQRRMKIMEGFKALTFCCQN